MHACVNFNITINISIIVIITIILNNHDQLIAQASYYKVGMSDIDFLHVNTVKQNYITIITVAYIYSEICLQTCQIAYKCVQIL